MRGRFIVFEGLDGSGKSTHIKLLAAALKAEGRHVATTAEPTDSVTGGLLRDALKGVSARSEWEMALLFALDRVNHNINSRDGINKLLNEGIDVICDRYYYSSLAYQGNETDFDWVMRLNTECPEILKPDLCVFLDLEPSVCIKRIGAARATEEIYENIEKLTKCREKFFGTFDALRSKGDKIVVIDADRDIENVAKDIATAVFEIKSEI